MAIRIPYHIRNLLILFVASRALLLVIGAVSRAFAGGPLPFYYSDHVWLAMWGVWDSGWYLSIAMHGYTAGASIRPETFMQANYAFFPLYPLLVHLVGRVVSSYLAAGILVSNACLLAAAYYLRKLIALDYDEQTADRTVLYLFLFPLSFIFSGVFTESLYLLLVVLSFYAARRSAWLNAGAWGFFAALTRFLGVFLFVPLAYEYAKAKEFSLKRLDRHFFALLLVPAGLALFAAYNYHLSGDPLAFMHIQAAWGRGLGDPLAHLLDGIFSSYQPYEFAALFTIVASVIVASRARTIRVSYLLFAASSILIPLATGLDSMPRYILVVFPIFLALAQLSANRWLHRVFVPTLILSQGLLMALWTRGTDLVK